MKIVAVLSSPIVAAGNWRCVENVSLPSLEGVTSYVGHPDTAKILEKLGVVQAPKGSLFDFTSLQPGESFVAVPLAAPDRSRGWTVDQPIEDLGQIKVKIITRLSAD